MEKKAVAVRVAGAVALASLSAAASAASVIDETTLGTITAAFGDMQDTTLALVASFFPYLVGITAVLFGPKLVARLAGSL